MLLASSAEKAEKTTKIILQLRPGDAIIVKLFTKRARQEVLLIGEM